MIVKSEEGYYKVQIFWRGKRELVHLGLLRGKEYAVGLTPTEAKQIAYALLLAAEKIDP